MKKLFGEFAILCCIILCVFTIAISATGCHGVTKDLGGEMTIVLEPNQKLELITWKEDSLWLLTRPMRDDENAEMHTYYEDSEWGVLEGKVTIIEKEE